MKTLSVRQFATVKRVAMNVNPLVTKLNKLIEKQNEIAQEIEELNREISGHESGVMALTGGYASHQLVKKQVTKIDKVDPKTQKAIVEVKYVPTEIVTYDKEKNQYYIPSAEDVDDTAKVEETASAPADAPFNPIEGEE